MKWKFDARWLLLLVVIIAVVMTTIIINSNHNDDSASKVAGTISTDNGDLKINWDKYPATDIELSETLNITESGTYHLTGSLNDGYIAISPASDAVVRLILENVTIKNSSGPAIACYSADDLVIELVGENVLEDGEKYSSDFDEDVTGAVYSKSDLTFQGDGTLNVTAHYQDAIVSKDDLKFNNGIYKIISNDDGIRGKDSVYIVNGDFNIEAIADAIKSTNETDTGKGFVLIENGNFNLIAGAKGIKAINSILIYDGNIVLNTYDDAIHSNNYIGILNGRINISAGDDGVHADRELIIDDGEITVAKAYEGLEAQVVTINGGKISLTTTDDGINAGGGADSSSTNRPGANPFNADENCVLNIKGGELYINASGDGVDSNGWLYFDGGTTVVDGPTNNGKGALDAGMGVVMSGGEVIAIGASGMAESLGSSSSIFNVSIYLSTSEPAKTAIEIKDSSGQTIIKHTSAKSFNHIAVGTTEFSLGETYTLYLDSEKYTTFTISDITTTVGNNMNYRR